MTFSLQEKDRESSKRADVKSKKKAKVDGEKKRTGKTSKRDEKSTGPGAARVAAAQALADSDKTQSLSAGSRMPRNARKEEVRMEFCARSAPIQRYFCAILEPSSQ